MQILQNNSKAKENKKSKFSFLIFLIVFYAIIFRDLFTPYIPLLGYLDEAYAILAVPIAICELYKNGWKIKTDFRRNNCCFFIIICLLFGLIGNIWFHYQTIQALLSDLFLNLKFWFSIYVSYKMFSGLDLNKNGYKIRINIQIVVGIFIILSIADYTLKLFPGEIRYGIKSTTLFYGVHTVFAAICAFLIGLFVIVETNTINSIITKIAILVLMVSTMRSKAFGAALMFVVLYYLVFKFNKKVKVWHIVLMIMLCLAIGWSQIRFYFFSDISSTAARNVLLRTSFIVANDHFPFGTGFATYASYYSGVSYSPIYSKYAISNIYGLTMNNHVYISDTFWPMLIAQNGYCGMLFFILALVSLFRELQECSRLEKKLYFSGIFGLGYLCISSLAESAFVNSFAIPIAILIGIVLKEKNRLIKSIG